MTPQVRRATAADWPTWSALRLTALRTDPAAFASTVADWHAGGEDRWRARLESPAAYNLVGLVDGRPSGLASGLVEDGRHQLRSVWVSPAARGSGLADLLVTTVEEWARRDGAAVLELTVQPGNGRAGRLYLRHGFVAAGDHPGPLLAFRKPL